MSIATKFGKAKLNNKGYYVIISRKEGNNGKDLHRLIFEEYYQIKLPNDLIIHHEDGDKTNNEIWNLVPMTRSEHRSLHNKGNLYNLGHKHSPETIKKISENNSRFEGNSHTIDSKIKMSKSKDNKTGIFRVYKKIQKQVCQGFVWAYDYYDDTSKRRSIRSTNILKLKEKVLDNGLEWIILDNEKVKSLFGVKLADKIIDTLNNDTYESND